MFCQNDVNEILHSHWCKSANDMKGFFNNKSNLFLFISELAAIFILLCAELEGKKVQEKFFSNRNSSFSSRLSSLINRLIVSQVFCGVTIQPG
jgi:hypothetical protein